MFEYESILAEETARERKLRQMREVRLARFIGVVQMIRQECWRADRGDGRISDPGAQQLPGGAATATHHVRDGGRGCR